MVYKLDLDFTKPKKTNLPGPSRAAIYVKTCTKNDRGRIFITPEDCISMKELDYCIKRLIGDLEDIRKKAKQKFSVKQQNPIG